MSGIEEFVRSDAAAQTIIYLMRHNDACFPMLRPFRPVFDGANYRDHVTGHGGSSVASRAEFKAGGGRLWAGVGQAWNDRVCKICYVSTIQKTVLESTARRHLVIETLICGKLGRKSNQKKGSTTYLGMPGGHYTWKLISQYLPTHKVKL